MVWIVSRQKLIDYSPAIRKRGNDVVRFIIYGRFFGVMDVTIQCGPIMKLTWEYYDFMKTKRYWL